MTTSLVRTLAASIAALVPAALTYWLSHSTARMRTLRPDFDPNAIHSQLTRRAD